MIKQFELIFMAHIKYLIFKSNVIANMLEIMEHMSERKKDFCKGLQEIMMKKSISMRTHYYVKFFNGNLRKGERVESIRDGIGNW